VVSDPHKALTALAWCVTEMEERYKRLAALGVRNIDVFNNRVRNAKKRGERLARTVQTGFDERTGKATYVQEDMNLEPMPYIVIVMDEFADLMALAGREIEDAVKRLADAAKPCGIHLIMATERPASDIATQALKAGLAARISYKASKLDSRAIMGAEGAEQLLGSGDMLYANGTGSVQRIHGPYVSQEEVSNVASALRQQGAPRYIESLTGLDRPTTQRTRLSDEETARHRPVVASASDDALFDRAVAIVMRERHASRALLQRRLSISPAWAAALIQRLAQMGIIGPADAQGNHPVRVGAAA
jgi:DNA segregation ATPase FtsK/SpoIIIE, S-DNA-T family